MRSTLIFVCLRWSGLWWQQRQGLYLFVAALRQPFLQPIGSQWCVLISGTPTLLEQHGTKHGTHRGTLLFLNPSFPWQVPEDKLLLYDAPVEIRYHPLFYFLHFGKLNWSKQIFLFVRWWWWCCCWQWWWLSSFARQRKKKRKQIAASPRPHCITLHDHYRHCHCHSPRCHQCPCPRCHQHCQPLHKNQPS